MREWIAPWLALVGGVAVLVALLGWLGGGTPRVLPLPALAMGPLRAAFGADAEAQVVLAHPWLPLWLVLAASPALALGVRTSLIDARGWALTFGATTRALVLASIGVALAEPSLRAPVRGTTLVLAVDVSRSMDDARLAAAGALVAEVLAITSAEIERGVTPEDRTRLRVVTYAEGVHVGALETRTNPTDATRLTAAPLSRHERDLASDHAGALRLAEALLSGDTEGRLLLVTDGRASLAERAELEGVVRGLEARGVEVHARVLPGPERADILVEALYLPDELRVGQTVEIAIDVVASEAADVALALEIDGAPNELQPRIERHVEQGRTQLRASIRLERPGPITVSAHLDPATIPASLATEPENDAAAAVGEVRGRPRVLVASSDPSAALARALEADALAVERVAPSEIPSDDAALRAYDLFVLSDVPARALASETQHALVRAVRDGGAGLVMIGGERSFGVGGWDGTPIDDILPVRWEGERQRERPVLALMLVIDKSGSMSSEDKLDLVKEAARQTARALEPSDQLGVIAFDSRPQTIVRLQPASSRFRISSDIRRLTSGGGTNALPALREAYLQLVGSNALVKHVILLSDGQSPDAGINALLDDMRGADITVSAVGVGEGAGKDLLARVARRGRGRYYFSEDGTDVPRIFSRETKEVTRNAIVERELYPRVKKYVQALRGIDFDGAPGLRGIVPVQAKAQTETLLVTHAGDPLLVRGRRGLGRTAAFASDAQPRWATRWITWAGFAKLWSQIARDTMRQGSGTIGGATLRVAPGDMTGAWQITVDVDAGDEFANGLRGRIEVVDAKAPDAPAIVRDLHLVAPGRYAAELADIAAGQRLVRAQLFDPDAPSGATPVTDERGQPIPGRLAAEAAANLAIPWPSELAPDLASTTARGSASETAALARRTALDGLFDAPRREGALIATALRPAEAHGRQRTHPLWPFVLAWLVLPLFVLDLLIRRTLEAPR
jgi:Mg-chelatase subunit ChlD/uncharacterized membrane protein